MWLIFWSALALAGGKWDGKNADIVAERTIAAPSEAVYAALIDPNGLQKLYPADCADWGGPFDKSEIGGKAIVSYTIAGMNRRLDMILTRAEPSRVVDYDHPGNKGFVTRWLLAEAPTGTKVTMTTFLQAPPKGIRKYFYSKVQPTWQGCQERMLGNLEAAAVAAAPPAPAPVPDEAPGAEGVGPR